jgi:hypothetical protein
MGPGFTIIIGSGGVGATIAIGDDGAGGGTVAVTVVVEAVVDTLVGSVICDIVVVVVESGGGKTEAFTPFHVLAGSGGTPALACIRTFKVLFPITTAPNTSHKSIGACDPCTTAYGNNPHQIVYPTLAKNLVFDI